MAFSEQCRFNPDSAYEEIQGEVVPDDVPRQFSVPIPTLITSEKEFEKQLEAPLVRGIVDRLHAEGIIVAARHRASEIVFTAARHKKAIIAAGGVVSTGVGAYHILRRKKK